MAPYVLNRALSDNYRFASEMELSLSGFIGLDGIGLAFSSEKDDFSTGRGFVATGVRWNPAPNMIFKARLGAGFLEYELDAHSESSDVFHNQKFNNTTGNYQVRLDFNWDNGRDLLLFLGAEERFSHYSTVNNDTDTYPFSTDSRNFCTANNTAFTSAWTALEYTSEKSNGELGLRLDHLCYVGRDFSIRTVSALSLRLTLDWAILKNKGFIDTLALTVGTGLFAGLLHSDPDDTNSINCIQKRNEVHDFDLKQTRSWTSVAGIELEFLE